VTTSARLFEALDGGHFTIYMATPGKKRWPDDGGIPKIVADELVRHGKTNWSDDMLANYLCGLLDIPGMFEGRIVLLLNLTRPGQI